MAAIDRSLLAGPFETAPVHDGVQVELGPKDRLRRVIQWRGGQVVRELEIDGQQASARLSSSEYFTAEAEEEEGEGGPSFEEWLRDRLKVFWPDHRRLACSFCGKGQQEVRKLIAGPTVYICDECIGLCNDIIAEEKAREAGPSGGGF